MNTVGFVYSSSKYPEISRSILQYGTVYQVPIISISIKHLIDHYRGKPLIGERWNGTSIEAFNAELPQILDAEYNTFSKKSLKKLDSRFAEWLTEKNIRLIRQESVSKRHLPQVLMQSELIQYLIPTWDISSYSQLLQQLVFVKDAVLKPSNGRMGKGVCKLYKQVNGSVLLRLKDEQMLLNEAIFSDYLANIRSNCLGDELLLQPCLDFSLDADHAVDFRLLRHRGSTGEWEEAATYARIGASSLVSNVSQGGFIADAKEILYQIAGDKAEDLYKEIMHIGEELPRMIQKYSDETVFCLGMDVAVDRQSMRPFILEANTYPGTKYHTHQLAEKRVQYYQYLLKRKKLSPLTTK